MENLIKIEATDKSFSSFGGTLLAKNLVRKLGITSTLEPYLPRSKKKLLPGGDKFEALLYGFLLGNDHLDDWQESNYDAAIKGIQPRTFGPKCLGDYLRAFSNLDLTEVRRELINLSFKLRGQLGGFDQNFILDLDSSLHKQYGSQMEGVEYCYKKFKALDSIMAFDELGLPYWHDVRPGSTYTSNGCSQIIHEVFSRMPKLNRKQRRKFRRIVRADSGFFTSEFFNSCRAKNAGFVCAAKKNDNVKDKIARIKNWEPQDPEDPSRILAVGYRECEIGHISYHPSGYKGALRLVVIRALKRTEERELFPKHREYDYYPFVTSMGLHEYSDADLIKLYRGRGNAENMIKEQKYNFDLKHFPCLKLSANKAFGLIATFAYGLSRFMALSSPHKKKTKDGVKKIIPFAKRLRHRCILIPAQIIRHAGSVTFRFNQKHFQEVIYWQTKIKNYQFGFS